jgi:5-formyltetrahydrofolate cyclo-ligase
MPAGTIAETKAAIRACVLARRNALTPGDRACASLCIQQRILAMGAFTGARVVMAYCGFGSELDTSLFLAKVYARGKTLVLPRIDRDRHALAIFTVRDPDRELVANAWGIREPRPDVCAPALLSELDFILVPGLAFDSYGGRLGYGKGYYDRLFHACAQHSAAPFTVAGAFEAQMMDRVPMEPHDVTVPCIVTEARTIGAAAAPGHNSSAELRAGEPTPAVRR